MASDALGTYGAGPTGVVSAQEHRLAITAILTGLSTGALDARTGVFPGPNSLALVTGTAATGTMTVGIAAHLGATARTSASGTYLGPHLEAATTVNIAAAPGANSRIDVVYAKQQDADASVPSPDASTAPLYGVAAGTAAASPTKPAIPTGALELATVTVAAGATSTNGAGVTISNTVRQTVARGGVVPRRTGDVLAPAYDGHTSYLPGVGLQTGVGGAWTFPLDDTGWVDVSGSLGAGFTAGADGTHYRVKGGICYYQFNITRGTSSTTGTVYTFPTSARPAYTHWGLWTSAAVNQGEAKILPFGVLSFLFSVGSATGCVVSGSFPVG